MNSIGENCNELKKQYDACFNSWFAEKFLKGNTNDSACADLFKVYQQCVKDAIKQQHIELVEIDGDYLGSDKEYKIPPQNPKQSSTSDKSSSKTESTSNSKWNSANS